MERFDNLKRITVNELKKLDNAYAGKEEFTPADCDKFYKLIKELVSLLTATAMMESENYTMEGMSGRHTYGPTPIRYYGHNDGYSGHYPPPPYYGGYPNEGTRNW